MLNITIKLLASCVVTDYRGTVRGSVERSFHYELTPHAVKSYPFLSLCPVAADIPNALAALWVGEAEWNGVLPHGMGKFIVSIQRYEDGEVKAYTTFDVPGSLIDGSGGVQASTGIARKMERFYGTMLANMLPSSLDVSPLLTPEEKATDEALGGRWGKLEPVPLEDALRVDGDHGRPALTPDEQATVEAHLKEKWRVLDVPPVVAGDPKDDESGAPE